jgi:hypothetical protein
MRLRTRRTLCLSALLAVLLVSGVAFIAGRSRITQANFDRIQEGMTLSEVEATLGEGTFFRKTGIVELWFWDSGRIHIAGAFLETRLEVKNLRFRTAWETLT